MTIKPERGRPLEGLVDSSGVQMKVDHNALMNTARRKRNRAATISRSFDITPSKSVSTQYEDSHYPPLDLSNSFNGLIINHLNATVEERQLRYHRHQRVLKGIPIETFESLTKSNDTEIMELETIFDGDSGNYGVMFDLSSPNGTHTVTINEIDVHVNIRDSACSVLLYGHRGTHVGVESSSQPWFLVINTTVSCAGYGKRTNIPLGNSSIVMEGGETIALYASMETPNLRYSYGQGLGRVYTSSKYLAIHEGTGLSATFGDELIRPRVWNGAVVYHVENSVGQESSSFVDGGCENSISTTFNDNLGSFGNMFDIATYSSTLSIHGLDFYTDLFTAVTYRIYTKEGSYVHGDFLSNWTLVSEGTTLGWGAGQGTPVRNFAAIHVAPNSTQGFYVTLETPDMRYIEIGKVLAGALAGDVFMKNEDLEIQIGVSMGSYPLSNQVFGPRLWCGTLHYTADHTCTSAAPSVAPSFSPSITPTKFPSTAPTMGDIDLGNCSELSTLKATMEGGTSAFGSMFTVSTLTDPIVLTSISFHTGSTDVIKVQVFTKGGEYKGYETDKTAWHSIVNTSLQGAGFGSKTQIPESLFREVAMQANTTRAFYVITSTPELFYSRTSVKVGDPYASDRFLQVKAGAGIADPYFGTSIYEPRIFNGALSFRHAEDCFAMARTEIPFEFYLQHASTLNPTNVSLLTSKSVASTLANEIQSGIGSLASYVTDYQFDVVSVTSVPSTEDECIPESPDLQCTAIDTTVSVQHKKSLSAGDATFALREYQEKITSNLNLVQGLKAQYAGEVPLTSFIRVTLDGTFGINQLTVEELTYYEDITKAYLLDQLNAMKINVLGVAVAAQSVQPRGRKLQGSVSNSLRLDTTITGEYRPPPFVDFDGIVTDALDADGGQEFRDELITGGRTKPEGLPVFNDIEAAYVERLSTLVPTPSPSPTRSGGPISSKIPIVAAVGAAVSVLFFIASFCWVRRCRKRRSTAADGDFVFHDGGLKNMDTTFGFNGKNTRLAKVGIIDAECAYGGEALIMSDDFMAEKMRYDAKSLSTVKSSRSTQGLNLDKQLSSRSQLYLSLDNQVSGDNEGSTESFFMRRQSIDREILEQNSRISGMQTSVRQGSSSSTKSLQHVPLSGTHGAPQHGHSLCDAKSTRSSPATLKGGEQMEDRHQNEQVGHAAMSVSPGRRQMVPGMALNGHANENSLSTLGLSDQSYERFCEEDVDENYEGYNGNRSQNRLRSDGMSSLRSSDSSKRTHSQRGAQDHRFYGEGYQQGQGRKSFNTKMHSSQSSTGLEASSTQLLQLSQSSRTVGERGRATMRADEAGRLGYASPSPGRLHQDSHTLTRQGSVRSSERFLS